MVEPAEAVFASTQTFRPGRISTRPMTVDAHAKIRWPICASMANPLAHCNTKDFTLGVMQATMAVGASTNE